MSITDNMNLSVTVIGAGSYGTALAVKIAKNGNNVILWGHNSKHISTLKANRCNTAFLPNVSFPDTLHLESNLDIALTASRNILIVVPSYAFSNVLHQIKPLLRHDARIIWATKGLEIGTGRLLQEVAREILGSNIPIAIISGPTFAKELATSQPMSIALSSTDKNLSEDLRKLLKCDKNLHVFISSDCIGMQISGVVKNVIAISAGISDGIGYGANARVSLITRGLNEMSRLGIMLGANPATFIDMFCLGDLVLTCTDNQSRNRRFGIMLGKDMDVQVAQNKIGQIVEGYRNVREIRELASRFNVDMPIVEAMYQILFCNKNRREEMLRLLEYP